MIDDYTEDDRWDWDKDDPSQYCHHGTFIGSWWGPDVMCSACESAEPDWTLREILQEHRDMEDHFRQRNEFLMNVFSLMFSHLFDDFKIDEDDAETMEKYFTLIKASIVRFYMDQLDSNAERGRFYRQRYDEDLRDFLPFCENGNWDDPNMLYNYHRHKIDEFRKGREVEM